MMQFTLKYMKPITNINFNKCTNKNSKFLKI